MSVSFLKASIAILAVLPLLACGDASYEDVPESPGNNLSADAASDAVASRNDALSEILSVPVGRAISKSEGKAYTWLSNGVVQEGTISDPDYYSTKSFSLPPGYRATDILAVGISTNGNVVTWFDDGYAAKGTPTNLDRYVAPYRFYTAQYKARKDVVGVAISANNYVVAWYADGTVSKGTSSDFDSRQSPRSFTAATTPNRIREIAIDAQNRVFTWYSSGEVSAGKSTNLGLHSDDNMVAPSQVLVSRSGSPLKTQCENFGGWICECNNKGNDTLAKCGARLKAAGCKKHAIGTGWACPRDESN